MDKTKALVATGLECFQHLEQAQLREMKNIGRSRSYCRILELTGWTIMVRLNAGLCMEKIDTERGRYKEKQKNQAREESKFFACHGLHDNDTEI